MNQTKIKKFLEESYVVETNMLLLEALKKTFKTAVISKAVSEDCQDVVAEGICATPIGTKDYEVLDNDDQRITITVGEASFEILKGNKILAGAISKILREEVETIVTFK